MTPAEVLAMRDRLTKEMWEAKLGVCYDDCVSVADWLLTSRLTREKIAIALAKRKSRDWDSMPGALHVAAIHAEYPNADAVLALLTDTP